MFIIKNKQEKMQQIIAINKGQNLDIKVLDAADGVRLLVNRTTVFMIPAIRITGESKSKSIGICWKAAKAILLAYDTYTQYQYGESYVSNGELKEVGDYFSRVGMVNNDGEFVYIDTFNMASTRKELG